MCKRLEEFLERQPPNRRRAWLASKCGVAVQTVGRWCDGSSIPQPAQMVRLMRVTGFDVMPNDFYVDYLTDDAA